MIEENEAVRSVLADIAAGTDVLVGGTPVQARVLFAEAARMLAEQATVVSVASPIGELSLSHLIAQLSGRLDLDNQDDSWLELGFKRLTGDGRTVLMVLAPAGISRSALRYLQHVALQAPGLLLVMYKAAPLAAMLQEPGFAPLLARVSASPAIEFDRPAEAARPEEAVMPVFASLPELPAEPVFADRVRLLADRVRRPLIWTASALGVAAIAALLWAEHDTSSAAVGSKIARAEIRRDPAVVPVPVPARLPGPETADASPPPAVGADLPPLIAAVSSGEAAMPPVALAAPPAQPRPEPLAEPALIAAGLAQVQVKAERSPHVRHSESARRETPRIARARPDSLAPRRLEAEDTASARQYDGVSPVWVRRDPRRGDGPFLGTYAVDSHGIRVFEYDP